MDSAQLYWLIGVAAQRKREKEKHQNKEIAMMVCEQLKEEKQDGSNKSRPTV